jgi:cell division protein FtsZ
MTVIATGFRDQMPERRARMLTMENVPVVSVPVMASETWLDDPATAPAAEQGPPRFKSQIEDGDEELEEEPIGEPVFFASSGPVTSSVTVVAPASASADEAEPNEKFMDAPARPRFAEMGEVRSHTPLPRDYASEFGSGVLNPPPREPKDRDLAEPASLFPEAVEEPQQDLDVPAFMRRTKF